MSDSEGQHVQQPQHDDERSGLILPHRRLTTAEVIERFVPKAMQRQIKGFEFISDDEQNTSFAAHPK